LPHERIAAEVTSEDVLVEGEPTERPQLDLEVFAFDTPHATGRLSEEVGAGAQLPGQAPSRCRDPVGRTQQAQVEVAAGAAEQVVAQKTAGKVAGRLTERFPYPHQRAAATERLRTSQRHRAPSITNVGSRKSKVEYPHSLSFFCEDRNRVISNQ
jgi:hypothetical protein